MRQDATYYINLSYSQTPSKRVDLIAKLYTLVNVKSESAMELKISLLSDEF